MRINRQSLIRVIHNTVDQRTRTNRNLIAIYLCGSVLGEDYALGGTVDLDLFFVHAGSVETKREIVRLTDEVTLDIAHHEQSLYRDTRSLRVHPWMGPNINNCEIYYDPSHFMDFTQASVRGQYDRPDYIFERARKQVNSARQIWFTYEREQPEAGPENIREYLLAIRNAANAIASLTGAPLTERRFLLNLPERTEAINRPGLFPGFMGLIGAPNIDREIIKSWLHPWEEAYESLPADSLPPRLHPVRKYYYLRAFNELLDSDQPNTVLWPLIYTWTLAVHHMPSNQEPLEGWHSALDKLGFLGDGFSAKIKALDAFLDQVEETIDDWAAAQGIQELI